MSESTTQRERRLALLAALCAVVAVLSLLAGIMPAAGLGLVSAGLSVGLIDQGRVERRRRG